MGRVRPVSSAAFPEKAAAGIPLGGGVEHSGDALTILPQLPEAALPMIVAQSPYFQVGLEDFWDTAWASPEEYVAWTVTWVRAWKHIRPMSR